MQTITALKQQVRNDKRISVFLDDAFAFGLPESVAQDLVIGQQLSAESIQKIQQQADAHAAMDSAYHQLAHRPRSSAEIRRALTKKEYAPDIIDVTIEQLEQKKLIDDHAFAAYWVEQRNTFRPRSHMALRQELRQKGIAREIIDVALEQADEQVAAMTVARKKSRSLATLPERDFRTKLGRFLQQRGYGYGIIRDVSDQIWQEIQQDRETP
jgi:regulatory protein